jgi:anti-sigma B factor antagonist
MECIQTIDQWGKGIGIQALMLSGAAQECESKTLVFSNTIDLASSPSVRKYLLSALAAHRHLTIDFSQLPFIDSAGIAVFVEALHIAKTHKRSMVFVGVQGSALQLMELTRLDQVFTLRD